MSGEGLRQYIYVCMTLYKDCVKHSNVDDSQSLGIVVLTLDGASGNKSASFDPKGRYYESNDRHDLSNNDKYKVLNMRSVRNEEKNASKSGGYYKSGGGVNNGKWKSNIAILWNHITDCM